MEEQNKIPLIVDIPESEKKIFDKKIKEYRSRSIRSSQAIVNRICEENEDYIAKVSVNKDVSTVIYQLREKVWNEFLLDEIEFNALLMKDLHKILNTPKEIMEVLIASRIVEKKGEDLVNSIKDLCGEYAGRVFPYFYRLSLSNTQSRRSRAGKTFESIIYKIYEVLDYRYDSQSKIGRKIFDQAGLGKKVDSILPGIEEFNKRRNKTIVGTMKTTLRERWQEVAEEIERTKIPEIHLLTADEDISLSKSREMANHNIVIVTYKWISESEKLKKEKNIISFEEYLFEEIPSILDFWK